MIALGDRVSDPVGSGWVLAASLGFFVTGCVLLPVTGPSLGALHAFAAFIVLAIVAALNQLLPVLTHAPVAKPQAVIAVAAGFTLGFALLIAGFYGAPTFVAAGAILAVTSVVWVVWNLVRLWAGHGERQTRVMMTCSVAGFAVAAGIGAPMACALGGRCAPPVLGLAPLHATMAIAAFASLLIVAISYRFVPMFGVAHGDAYGRRAIQWVAVASVVVVASFLRSPVGVRIGLVGLLVCAVLIGSSHARTLAKRLRKRLDVSLRYGAVAWVLGILAIVVAIAASWQSTLATATVIVAVLGWISITILGYAYKVAGFLAWQFAKERDPSAALPALSIAVPLPLAYAALALLGAGTIVSALCSFVAPDHMRVGFALYGLGGVGAVAALGKLAVLYVARKPNHGIELRRTG